MSTLTLGEIENGASASVHDEVYSQPNIRAGEHGEIIQRADSQTPSAIGADIAMRLKVVALSWRDDL